MKWLAKFEQLLTGPYSSVLALAIKVSIMRFLRARQAQQHSADEFVSIIHMGKSLRVFILDSCSRCNHAGGRQHATEANGCLNLYRMGISTLKEFIWRVWAIREDLEVCDGA